MDINKLNCLIDLHLHFDGSLSVENIKELAKMQGIDIPEDDADLLRLITVNPDCRDLNEYLEKFDFPLSLLQTEEGIETGMYNLCEELKEQGLVYAEIRFAPQLHLTRGLTQKEVVEAAIRGKNRSDLKCNLILCCMRMEDNEKEDYETIRLTKEFLGKGVCLSDLAGAEAIFSNDLFADEFAHAKEIGVPFTLHAGEADGPKSIESALDMGAERIGHGVRCIEDEALVDRLAKEGVILELCPTSNLNTNIFSDIKDYPIPLFMDKDVRFTVNTDNMTVSGTNLKKEWQMLIDTFEFCEEDVYKILLNSVDGMYADGETKAYVRDVIDENFARKE